MPGMILFCRRWYTSTDDFVYPGIKSIFVYGIGLTVVAIVFSVHQDVFDDADCKNGWGVRMYYIGMMVLLTTHIVVSALLCACSMQGAIVDIRRRRGVPYVLYAKGVLFLPELIWLFLGTYWAFSDSGCERVVVVTVQALVVVGWVMFVLLLIGVVVVFDPLGHKQRKSHSLTSTTGSFYMDRNTDGSGTATKQLWETRCKLICCCARGDENSNNAFNDVAQLFTNFFEGMDLVPTDIAAGLILVQKDHQKAPQRLKRSRLVLRSRSPSPGLQPATPTKTGRRVVPRHMPLPRQARSTDSEPVDPWVLRAENRQEQAGGGRQASRSPPPPSPAKRSLSKPPPTDPSAVLVEISPTKDTAGELIYSPGVHSDINSKADNNSSSSNSKVDPHISSQGSEWGRRPRGERLDPQSWMAIHNATHFMRYAMASYGWPLYMYTNLTLGCCRLWAKCRCCCPGSGNANVHNDNCCQCHTAAIRNLTGVEDEDIVYASFHNAIYQIPFYVALDHSRSSIIIAIRGTLSLRDALTDLTAESQDLDIPGVEAPCKAHKGIMRAASYVHRVLKESAILETAFTLAPNYQLVITGHSLGAGAATLLSIMLRPSYPNLKCFAFSPPGGLLSHSLAEYTEEFVCSVVMGHDLVPRLGIVSMEDLKTKVLRCIKDSHRPKYKILAGGIWTALCGLPKSEDDVGRQPLLQRDFTLAMPCYGSREETLSERQLEEAILMSGRSRQVNIPLYPPGKIIYIEEDTPSKTCFGESGYTAAWARPEVFEEILVSPRMLTDHMPDAVFKALLQLADKNFNLREIVRVRRVESIEEGLI